MTCTIAEVYRAEVERHKRKLAEIDREAERRLAAGELTAAEQTAWLEATYGDGNLSPAILADS